MREVNVFKWEQGVSETGRPKSFKVFDTMAHFHQWGQDHDGQGEQVPVAIVELPDGSIRSVYCELVMFAQPISAAEVAQVISL